MNVNKKIFALVLGLVLFSACSNIPISNPFTENVPDSVNQAVISRVNPESQIHALGVATLKKSGNIVAQSNANKKASEDLKRDIKKYIMSNYNSHLDNMDSFSKSVVKPVLSDLADYSTAIIMKKASQKGAWQDGENVYSLLVVERQDIFSISEKVLRDFVVNTAKNLEKSGLNISDVNANVTNTNENNEGFSTR